MQTTSYSPQMPREQQATGALLGASLGVGLQHRRHVYRPSGCSGQRKGVVQRQVGALRHVRGDRMRCVAKDCHRAVSKGRQRVLQVVDVVHEWLRRGLNDAPEALAPAAPRRALELLHLVLWRRGHGLPRPGEGLRAVLVEEPVDEPVAEAVQHGMLTTLRPMDKVQAIPEVGVSLLEGCLRALRQLIHGHFASPCKVPREAHGAGSEMLAEGRARAVGSHKEVASRRRPLLELHPGGAILLDLCRRRPPPVRDTPLGQQSRQRMLHLGVERRAVRERLPGEHSALGRPLLGPAHALQSHARQGPQTLQDGHRGVVEPDACAGSKQRGAPLEDLDLTEACCVQACRGRQAADGAAQDDHAALGDIGRGLGRREARQRGQELLERRIGEPTHVQMTSQRRTLDRKGFRSGLRLKQLWGS
mmetsp:Transcript_79319/g.208867  ORF Transcript_79319/g.208867 Transcript_79319/m.208867 type:complete len:418 (-) Transcript_79319:2-1255(-)